PQRPDPVAVGVGQARLLRWIYLSASCGAARGPARDHQDPDKRRSDPVARLHGGDLVSVQRHELHLLTGSYALDALSDEERAEFEKHLDECPSCAEEVRGLLETASRLAMATAVTPPAGMRRRALAAAPLTRQVPPTDRSAPR